MNTTDTATAAGWSSGYVADLGYTYGCCAELNPLRMRFALLYAGLAPPEVNTACELGFGQGISLNIHAAASGVRWWGTDFLPAHARFASGLAAASGNGAAVFGDSIEAFLARDDLPEFDYIGLHGVWSWVTPGIQQQIVQCLEQKLKPGGVAYVSYNAQPGWATFAPVRQLMVAHAEAMRAGGEALPVRITKALEYLREVFAAAPAFARLVPQMATRVEQLGALSVNYLAHEYFNAAWDAVPFSAMARTLATAGLSHACSAHLLDHVAVLNLGAAQQALLAGVEDPTLREDTRDFMVNRQFRRDYWVKGARKLTAAEREEALRQVRVVLTLPRESVQLKATGALGESVLDTRRYVPIIDVLADNLPRTIGEVETAVAAEGLSFDALTEALVVLVGTGQVAPAQDEQATLAASASSQRMNVEIARRARESGEITALACPVSGGGVEVGRMSQLFLHARAIHGDDSHLWALYLWDILGPQGHRFQHAGHFIEEPEANRQRLDVLAGVFKAQALPVLRRLGMARD